MEGSSLRKLLLLNILVAEKVGWSMSISFKVTTRKIATHTAYYVVTMLLCQVPLAALSLN